MVAEATIIHGAPESESPETAPGAPQTTSEERLAEAEIELRASESELRAAKSEILRRGRVIVDLNQRLQAEQRKCHAAEMQAYLHHTDLACMVADVAKQDLVAIGERLVNALKPHIRPLSRQAPEIRLAEFDAATDADIPF